MTTTPPPPSSEAVEAAIAYTSINHKVDAMSEDVMRILWANFKPDCAGFSSGYPLTAARILAAEVERLRAWKQSAMDMLSAWDTVWESAGKPGTLGCCKSVATKAEVERLREQADAVCEWEPSKRWEYAHHTACGTTFNHEGQIKFCPACGRKVKIQSNENEQ